MAEKTATSLTIESSSTPSIAQADVVSQNSSSNSELVDEVFSLFKGYLTSQLQEKGRPMISPQILKMRRRFAKPKLPLRRSEKKRRVTSVTLRKNLSLLVIFSFFAVRPLFIFTLWSSRAFWLDCLSIQPSIRCIKLFEEENNLRSFERSELDRKWTFLSPYGFEAAWRQFNK